MTKERANTLAAASTSTVTAVELDLRDQLAGKTAEVARLVEENEILRRELSESGQAASIDELRSRLAESEADRLQEVHELEERFMENMALHASDIAKHTEEMRYLATRLRSTLTWRAGRVVTMPLKAADRFRRNRG